MTLKQGRPRVNITREEIEKQLRDSGLSLTQLSVKLDISRDTLERRLKQPSNLVSKQSSARPASSGAPVSSPPPSLPNDKEVPLKSGKIHLLSQAVGNGIVAKYFYNDKTDSYITFMRTVPEPLVVSGVNHRAMAQAYSDWDGNPSSVNDICRTFSFPRPWFMEYKTVHGWTHDKEPFSAEELMDKPVEQLVEVALQMKRQALSESFEIQKWHETQQDADKWRKFEETVLKPLSETIAEHAPTYQPPLLSFPKILPAERFALVLSPTDLHFGKPGWSDAAGQTYSKPQTEQLLISHSSRLVSQVMRHGRPEVIYIPVGSDWFHVDTQNCETTAGTQQDLDGLPENMFYEGKMLAVRHIDLMRQLAPVVLVFCPGNHDYQNSLNLLHFLMAWYRDTPDVEVRPATQPRQYVAYGNSLIGFVHGNDEKPGQLGGLMSTEAKEAWGQTDFRYFFTGHLHHEITRELNGVTQFQLPSLSSADRWHEKKGFVLSRRAIHAHKVSYDQGIDGLFISSVIEMLPARNVSFGFKLANRAR